MLNIVFTIGHSTHSQESFIALLRQHRITAVCDVRSMPYSRINPQFNREDLENALQVQSIQYRFLGKELGARSDDPLCYEGGKVQYERLAKTNLFKRGIKRVLRGMNDGFRIAIMCAEREPLECHRTILVARHLDFVGVKIVHIHADGHIESHEDALSRLMKIVNLPENNMFYSREVLLEDAYRRQEERIAYEVRKPVGDDSALKGAAG